MFDELEDPEDTRSGSFESYFFVMQEFLAQPFFISGDLPKRNWWCYNTKEYDFDKTGSGLMLIWRTGDRSWRGVLLKLFIQASSDS